MLVLLFTGFGIPAGIIGYMIYVAFFKKRKAFGALALEDDEAVILKIHGESVEDRFKTCEELQHFVASLQWEMGNLGEVRDVNIAENVATVTIFGESAEEIYAQVRKVLRHTSFSRNASVTLRYGAPGSAERRTHMAN